MKRNFLFFLCLLLTSAFIFPVSGRAEPIFNQREDVVSVPEISIYRRDIPESEGLAFVQQIHAGWNLGNTMDAYADGRKGNDLETEAVWCGVYTTEEMIQTLQEAGFNAVRIPVSWHNHVDDEFRINEKWLNRVQEIVDYAYSRGMFVIVNTHHDVYPAYYYPLSPNLPTSEKYIQAIWAQVSERFAEYGDHLIFESMNEPRLKDTEHEWNFDDTDSECLDSMDCINRLNQLFVDTVRAAGGYNVQRYLMIPSYDASYAGAVNPNFHLPEDSTEGRLIVSVHAYTPYSFALDAGGTDSFSTSLANSQAHEIVLFMNALYDQYICSGIPIIIGEYGARNKNENLQARVDFAATYVALASARCIPCFWWDNNVFQPKAGEAFGLLQRKTLKWPFPQIVDAIMKYSPYTALPEYQK